MGQQPPVQAAQPDPTAWVKLEDETLATNKAAVSIPLGIGEHKTTVRWLTPIYGQNVVETKVASGGGKGGGKGGGGQTKTTYYGTIAGSFASGPGWGIEWLLVNSQKAYEGELVRGAANYSDITLKGFGPARIYWGTETQIVDPSLAAFGEDCAYRGMMYIVLKNCSFGPNGETNAPTIEVCWRKLPNQSIITNAHSSAGNDGAYTANPIACGAELLTSWDWCELSADKLDAPSFQATADALQPLRAAGANADRCAVAIAPLWNERVQLQAALADIGRVAKAWFRLKDDDGKIEAGYWRRDGSLDNVPALTINDLSMDSVPEISVADSDTLPNSFVVEFTNATKHHKGDAITVNNLANIQRTGLRRQTLKRPFRLLDELARIDGNEALRDAASPIKTITLSVRRSKARKPDGSRLREGDYFTFPVQLLPSEPADVRLFRCTRIEFDPTGPVTVSGELETNGALHAVVPDNGEPALDSVMPPVYYRRVISLPAETPNDSPPVYFFAAKPSDVAVGAQLSYSEDADGDFQTLGSQLGFALPVSLVQAVSASDATVRVSLLGITAGGINPQRDAAIIRNWQGGAAESRDDQLLLVVLAKSAGAVTSIEVMSISGAATLVASDVFDVPVLRGRRGTAAHAFDAGSFPDVWTNYEAWITPRSALRPQTHADFDGLFGSSTDVYFRLTPFGFGLIYDPATAFSEHERREVDSVLQAEFVDQTDGDAHPTDAFRFPASLQPPISSGHLGYMAQAFKRAASPPPAPTGGTYADPIPVGWSAGNPAGTEPVYLSQRRFTPNGVGQDSSWSTPIKLEGVDGLTGNTGAKGDKGDNGLTSYFHVAYANNSDGSVGFNQVGGTYIGTYVDFNSTDSTDYRDYTWRLMKGSDGTNGIPGTNGANGQTSYLHIKYSDDGGSTFTAGSGETPGKYIGQYVDFTLADSTSVAAYTWALIKGQDGPGTYTPVLVGTMSNLGAGNYTKTSGPNAWDSKVYSAETFARGASVSFHAVGVAGESFLMVGLSTDPTSTPGSYLTIDYAIYLRNDGVCEVQELGTSRGSFGSYAAGDVFSVTYDNLKVRYSKNGVVFREVSATSELALHLDSSFFAGGSSAITNVLFAPFPTAIAHRDPITVGGGGSATGDAGSYGKPLSTPLEATVANDGTTALVRIAGALINASGSATTCRVYIYAAAGIIAQTSFSAATGGASQQIDLSATCPLPSTGSTVFSVRVNTGNGLGIAWSGSITVS